MAAKLLSQVVDFYQKRYREMSGVPQGDGTPIEQMIPALIALPPEVYGAYAFRRDPIQGRFDRQQRKELIARALACGREQAEEYRRRFGALRPSEIARRLGLKLDSPSIPEGGGRVLFASLPSRTGFPSIRTAWTGPRRRSDGTICPRFWDTRNCGRC